MLKNYITSAINNLLKNRLFSVINIFGLAIGLAACILLTLYVRDELSYDKHWEKADRLYRINIKNRFGGSENIWRITSAPLLPALKKFFPEEIELGTRIQEMMWGVIKVDDANHPGTIAYVDRDFIDMFRCEVLKGSVTDTLLSPGNLALTEERARQYFGAEDPIGKSVALVQRDGMEKQFRVTAVYRFTSPNTVLDISGFSLLNETTTEPPNWFYIGWHTYIRLSETTDIEQFVDKLPDFVNQNVTPNNRVRLLPDQKMSDRKKYMLQEMSDIYFNPYGMHSSPGHAPPTGNRTVIVVFIAISVLILIIACINFVILTTAKATQRAREVAMRKVAGARFRQLLVQFLGESVLVAFIAFLVAITITELALPYFELLVRKELAVPYLSQGSYLFGLLLLILIGLLGGLYPAVVLSGFSPVRALKANQTTEAGGSIQLRNILVIFQFSASIALIIATLVAFFQLQYAKRYNPGFNPENLLVVEDIDRQEISPFRKTLQQELLQLPDVNNVALSTFQPNGFGNSWITNYALRRKTDDATPNQEINSNIMFVGWRFFDTYKIPLLSGRYFTRGMDQEEPSFLRTQNQPGNNITREKRIIINSAAARLLGYSSTDEAVGGMLLTGDPGTPGYAEYSIIGVVEDSQLRSLRRKPSPEIYRLSPDTTTLLTVRHNGEYQTVLEEVKRVWHEVVGDVIFIDSNVKQNLASTFAHEEKENKVLIAFALLSVFIGCLGLNGIATFTVDRRIQEIGIRKVMGARVKDIVKLLLWQFLKPVLIANIIAWPVAIFAMQTWLERFPYRFDSFYIVPLCLASALIALAIAWFTVASNTTRAARRSPIHSLRYE